MLRALSPRVEVEGDARFDQFTFAVNGPWFSLPGGETQTALGVEWSRDALRNEPDQRMLDGDIALGAQKSRLDEHRYSSAFYAEMSLPMTTWLHADAAWRIDHRQGFDSESSPMFGLKWKPLETLTVRATSATGYRAPSLFETRRPSIGGGTLEAVVATPALAPCGIPTSFEGVDHCPSRTVRIENPDLEPETSRSHTPGVAWGRRRASFRPERWIASASSSQRNRHHQRRRRSGGLPAVAGARRGRPAGGDQRLLHQRRPHAGRRSGAAIRIPPRPDARGRFTFRLAASYLSQLERQVSPDAPALDYAGHGSPKRSVLAGLEWLYGDWITTLNVHQLGPVEIAAPGKPCATLNEEAEKCRTPASTTADVYLAYAGFANWRLSLNIDNVTDRDPRNYDPAKGGYDIAYDDPRGRFYLVSAAYRF